MSSLSTHVLDSVRGAPAADVAVRLFRSVGDSWEPDGEGRTDGDGRLSDFAAAPLTPGTYRLVFGTAAYFAATGQQGFYPEVSICFEVVDERHHHVPLLLSPYAYSTYRGS
jgi:5-hydroxyisourate hydrolase